MSERRPRSDKGKKRKFDQTPRKAFLDFFASQPEAERERLMLDLMLIREYAPSGKEPESKLPEVANG